MNPNLENLFKEANIKRSDKSRYTVVITTASWCPPCKSFSPVFCKVMEKLDSDI